MTEEKKNGASGLSRREFLKDAGLLVGGAAIGSTVLLSACGGENTTETVTQTKTATETATTTATTTVQGGTSTQTVTNTVTVTEPGGSPVAVSSDAVTVNMTINNEEYQVQVAPEWSLQYLLHDVLGFMSIKDMCTGYGACGTCTAIVDGKPVLTCMMLACECDGAVIETAEGLANSKHPLIEAYVKYDCMQCGFCTPGFVVTAKALLDRNPNPTADEVNHILAGNLCRCGTYPQHAKAVLDAAAKLRGEA